MSDTASSPYRNLTREQLVQHIERLHEELEMSRVFTPSAETANGDATLQWQGRNRFLSERVVPVQLVVSDTESCNTLFASHRIINGDNLSVMTSLLAEFRGGRNPGVDVIYFDPPYNTGSDAFSYSDNYSYTSAELAQIKRRTKQTEKIVSLDDTTRHTKWINHIAPRLTAAYKLLKRTGVIIVSIDEHELPRLWMLMEEMFGEKNRIATLIWERSRKNDANYISEGHEYMLVWAKSKDALDAKRNQLAASSAWKSASGKWRKRKDGVDTVLTAYAEAKEQYCDDISKIQEAMDIFFKSLPKDHPARRIRYRKVNASGIYNDDGNLTKPEANGARYEVIHPVTGKPCKMPIGGWRYPQQQQMQTLIDAGRINFGADHNKIPRMITYLHEQELDIRTSVISNFGQKASSVVDAILGKGVFTAPKDDEMLAELFNLVTWRDKTAIILDAYAGSGTTGHAVIEMNTEDGGNRRFILIENGDPTAKGKIDRERYTTELTAERVRRVISGQWTDGRSHPCHETGFTFYNASKEIDKAAIMAATKETLADIILQVVEEDSNRIDCRMEGSYQYLIGRTRLGYGIALLWEGKSDKHLQPLTSGILDIILDEAKAAGVSKPVYIYATGNVAPIADQLYRFQHIPDSILARLQLLPGEVEADQ